MRTQLSQSATPDEDLEALLDSITEAWPALVLTGAGISVGSGIPTYRDEQGTWLRAQPITHQEFLSNPGQRQRYWGRSLLGWPAVREAKPSAAHRHLALLEARGAVNAVVTQNVDRLHQRSGSAKVIDLHGRLDRVKCLCCADNTCREVLQQRLIALNPHVRPGVSELRPDGDADLAEFVVDSIRIPPCERCGGTLMPDVVFFGGSIPGDRTQHCRQVLDNARALVVVGSSLQVYSGYRFCRWARESGKPIFLINPGATRADTMATKWSEQADVALERWLHRLDESFTLDHQGRRERSRGNNHG